MSGNSTDFHKLVARFAKEESERDTTDYGQVEWCLYCPGNGWSMNEVWRNVQASPPHDNDFIWAFWSDDQDLRNNYDYGEPAGIPTRTSPHSTIPGDWEFNAQGEPVSFLPETPGLSRVRKRTEKIKSKG